MTVLFMLFFHIVDDYYLQGWLASGKQKSWWEKNAPDEMYKHDYLMALFTHGFSWSFMVHLPLFALGYHNLVISILINGVIHSCIDHNKANMKTISLIVDQTFHIIQIVITYLLIVAL